MNPSIQPRGPLSEAAPASEASKEVASPVLDLKGVKSSIETSMQKLTHCVPKQRAPSELGKNIAIGLGGGVAVGVAGFSVAFGAIGVMILSGKDEGSVLKPILAAFFTFIGVALDVVTWMAAWPVRLCILAGCAAVGLIGAVIYEMIDKDVLNTTSKPLSHEKLSKKIAACMKDLETINQASNSLVGMKLPETDLAKMDSKDKASLMFLRKTLNEMASQLDTIKESIRWHFEELSKNPNISKAELAKLDKEKEILFEKLQRARKDTGPNIEKFLQSFDMYALFKEKEKADEARIKQVALITFGILAPPLGFFGLLGIAHMSLQRHRIVKWEEIDRAVFGRQSY